MPLSSTTVFEIRPGAGSATNGGGFVPGSSGTDWSQQNGPQYSVTDAVANGTTTVTSATASFGVDVVGNIAYINGAWYQIVSRTNATTIVVDRTIGTATGLTLKIGGALDLCATAEPLLTAGMTLWIKAGTQTLTTKLTLTNNGDATNGPIAWKGYHTTRGDHDGTQPLITTATNNVDLLMLATAGGGSVGISFRTFDNLAFSSTAGTPGNGITGTTNSGSSADIVISRCTISGCKIGICGDGLTYVPIAGIVAMCEIKSCTSHAIQNSGNLTLLGSYIHDCTGWGFTTYYDQNMIINVVRTVVYNCAAGGIRINNNNATATSGTFLIIRACDIVSNGGNGISHETANGHLAMLALDSNIVWGQSSAIGVYVANADAEITFNGWNAYGNNQTDRSNLPTGISDASLSADPFNGRTSNDFSLNSTAGAGAACKGAGFPGSIPGLGTAGAADIGTIQSASPGATNVITAPRRIFTVPHARSFRRPGLVLPGPTVSIVVQRRRVYPVPAFPRRHRSTTMLAAAPIVCRTPPRNIERRPQIRRNAAAALFTAPPTVLVCHPRIVR